MLQNTWITGGGGRGRGGPGGPVSRPVTSRGARRTGRRSRAASFASTTSTSSSRWRDGTTRTIRRAGDTPKVTINDPLEGHRKLLTVYTDKDIHDVTAYLVTLK